MLQELLIRTGGRWISKTEQRSAKKRTSGQNCRGQRRAPRGVARNIHHRKSSEGIWKRAARYGATMTC